MSAPERDPDEVARVLRSWFEQVRGFTGVDVANVTVPGTTGFSNETILFDATWAGTAAQPRELVARIAPSNYQVFPDDTFETQFEIMHALASTEVPTATAHWLEREREWFGQPFWIMDRIRGDIPTDNPPYACAGWLAEANPSDQARAWASGIEAMAAIHNLPLGDLGAAVGALGPPDEPTRAELDRYERFLRWAEDDRPHPLARTAMEWLRRHQPPEPARGPALVWGDARFANLIYRDFEVVAVLDWEMAAIADPLLDLGWWCFADETLTRGAGCDRLPGFESREDAAARWTGLTGRATDALDYYVVFAGLRFTVIMLRMGKLLAEIGLVPDGFAYDNLVSQGLERQLARA